LAYSVKLKINQQAKRRNTFSLALRLGARMFADMTRFGPLTGII